MNGGSFPPGLDPQKRAMTLEHLLTMSSGYFCDDANPKAPGNEDTMQPEYQEENPSYYKFTLAAPDGIPDPARPRCIAAPTPTWRSGCCPGERRIRARHLRSLARRADEDPQLRGLVPGTRWAIPSGSGRSVHLLPRDFMKLGQLMLDGGAWQEHFDPE